MLKQIIDKNQKKIFLWILSSSLVVFTVLTILVVISQSTQGYLQVDKFYITRFAIYELIRIIAKSAIISTILMLALVFTLLVKRLNPFKLFIFKSGVSILLPIFLISSFYLFGASLLKIDTKTNEAKILTQNNIIKAQIRDRKILINKRYTCTNCDFKIKRGDLGTDSLGWFTILAASEEDIVDSKSLEKKSLPFKTDHVLIKRKSSDDHEWLKLAALKGKI